MVQPNLQNPILVEIKQMDDGKTRFSNRRREPVNRVKRQTAFKINAQIIFVENNKIDAANARPETRSLGGIIENAIGYIVIRKIDLDNLGKDLDVGDKIISYGTLNPVECEYYLIGKKDGAHYADTGGVTLEKWFFEDRE